jgi:DNA-binding GntR family transcriptional regulator
VSKPSIWGKHRRIATVLRQRVADGLYPPGARLPSETALSQEFGAVRNTVRRALAALEAEGLITRLPSVGWFVGRPDEVTTGRPAPRYRLIADDLRAQISGGSLASGEMLPSESALVEKYGVSRFVVRQALTELQRDDLVVAIHGKGRFVR